MFQLIFALSCEAETVVRKQTINQTYKEYWKCQKKKKKLENLG